MGIYYVICGLWGDITTFCCVKPMFFIAFDSIIHHVEPKNTLRIYYKKKRYNISNITYIKFGFVFSWHNPNLKLFY